MTKITTYKRNKNSWKYHFVAELDNGKTINYITIVTAYGKKYATDCYIRSIEQQQERFGGKWISFWLESKELEKRLGE